MTRMEIQIRKFPWIAERIRGSLHFSFLSIVLYTRTHVGMLGLCIREAGASFEDEIYSSNVAHVCGMDKYVYLHSFTWREVLKYISSENIFNVL